MPVLTIIAVIVITGVILWLLNTYVPMDAKIKKILNVAVVIILILWLLSAFGVFGYLQNVQI